MAGASDLAAALVRARAALALPARIASLWLARTDTPTKGPAWALFARLGGKVETVQAELEAPAGRLGARGRDGGRRGRRRARRAARQELRGRRRALAARALPALAGRDRGRRARAPARPGPAPRAPAGAARRGPGRRAALTRGRAGGGRGRRARLARGPRRARRAASSCATRRPPCSRASTPGDASPPAWNGCGASSAASTPRASSPPGGWPGASSGGHGSARARRLRREPGLHPLRPVPAHLPDLPAHRARVVQPARAHPHDARAWPRSGSTRSRRPTPRRWTSAWSAATARASVRRACASAR